MRKTATAVIGGLAVAAVSPAFAQENSTFTGPRVEAIVGYDVTRAGSDVDNDASTDDDESMEGLVYGVGLGYDVAAGNAVLGAEAELTNGTAKTEWENGDLEGFGLGRVKTGRDIYVGARAGVLASPNTLVYVKGGYTNARFKATASDGTTRLRESFDTDGWRAGAGVERAIGENSFAKVEYRYSNYSRGEVDFKGEGVPDGQRFDIDTDRHQVVASVGMRF